MKRLIFTVLLISLTLSILAQNDPLLTYYEKSGFKKTPSYDETIAYCQQLDQASPLIHYTTFGTSPQGRDLPLLIFDAGGRFDPASARKAGKLVLLVQACIHPGESDGKDAGFMFFRDLAIRQQFGAMPENLTILFIPVFSVDGHERFGPFNRINQDGPEEMGWRTTAQNLNLNRDFLKADAPEMQAWLRLWSQWQPDFLMDIHVTDGADYQYVMTYGLETHGNMDKGLTDWTLGRFIPGMESWMESAGYPVHPYVMFRRWHDPRSGLRTAAAGPRYSQGYAAARNRVGILVENHSLKDYKTRVSSTYELLRITSKILEEEASVLHELNHLADMNTASAGFRMEPLPMSFKSTTDSIMVDFRGVEYDAVTSDLTGGTWFKYYPDKPASFKVPLFYQQLPANFILLPEAYIYPPEWSFITERLDWHGITYAKLEKPEKITVQSFRFRDYSWSKSSYEGRFTLTTSWDTIVEERTYPAGSIRVTNRQPAAKLIAHMFEPASPDSYLSWGFFNSIFEMKEYFETYVMEEYARKMIAETPGLMEEFSAWREANPEVKSSQWAQLEWFYRKSPYWDRQKDVYPVGKVLE